VNRKLLYRVLITSLFLVWTTGAQTVTSGLTPQRIVLNLTAEPATSMAVTWRTDAVVPDPIVQVAEAGDWIDFQKSAVAVTPVSAKVSVDSGNVASYHSAILTGLHPNTLYAYRVGGGNVWSEWNQFTTASDKADPFVFVFFGDPQVGIMDVVPRVLRESLVKAPQARFWLFTGDILELPQYDRLWREWFSATGFLHSIMPSIMAPGSHEYAFKSKEGVRWDVFTPLWNAHFTLPENGPRGLEERAYTIDYQGVRFILLDAQMKLAEQSQWLAEVLANNPNKWTIAAMHEPVFSVAKDRDGHDTRDAFMSLFDKFAVDLVLTGHDHVYSRTHNLKNGKVVPDSASGTVYVTSLSGEKSYPVNTHYKELMQKLAGNVQLFQVISFEGNELRYTSYTATGKVFDSFVLRKK
jgi:acid phosphatase type 7